jgi:hypothetical protein
MFGFRAENQEHVEQNQNHANAELARAILRPRTEVPWINFYHVPFELLFFSLRRMPLYSPPASSQCRHGNQ